MNSVMAGPAVDRLVEPAVDPHRRRDARGSDADAPFVPGDDLLRARHRLSVGERRRRIGLGVLRQEHRFAARTQGHEQRGQASREQWVI